MIFKGIVPPKIKLLYYNLCDLLSSAEHKKWRRNVEECTTRSFTYNKRWKGIWHVKLQNNNITSKYYTISPYDTIFQVFWSCMISFVWGKRLTKILRMVCFHSHHLYLKGGQHFQWIMNVSHVFLTQNCCMTSNMDHINDMLLLYTRQPRYPFTFIVWKRWRVHFSKDLH